MTSSRRAREVARTKEDILLAAAKALARGGPEAATMQAIAKEAGFSAASLYEYFGSKQEIFTGLMELLDSQLLAAFDTPIPKGLTLRQKLELLLRHAFTLADERREIFQLFTTIDPNVLCHAHASRRGGPPDSGILQFGRRLTEWLRGNATREELGGHTHEDAALLLVGVAFAYFHQWLAGGAGERITDRVDHVLELAFGGLQPVARRKKP